MSPDHDARYAPGTIGALVAGVTTHDREQVRLYIATHRAVAQEPSGPWHTYQEDQDARYRPVWDRIHHSLFDAAIRADALWFARGPDSHYLFPGTIAQLVLEALLPCPEFLEPRSGLDLPYHWGRVHVWHDTEARGWESSQKARAAIDARCRREKEIREARWRVSQGLPTREPRA